MKKELLIIAASLALATSMNASVNNTTKLTSNREIASSRAGLTQIAREAEPGDKRQGRGPVERPTQQRSRLREICSPNKSHSVSLVSRASSTVLLHWGEPGLRGG